MHLSVAISESRTSNVPALLRWLRTAAACSVEADEEGTLYVAMFNDFPQSVEAVAGLLSEVDDFSGVRIVLDGKPIENVPNFYTALLCYWQSLRTGGGECRRFLEDSRRSGFCPDHTCLPRCWIVCTTCCALLGDQGDRPTRANTISLAELAQRSEVAWCPNLRC
ncbi:MAG: hypothetical protein NNA20_08945 [Nitrospira sp.]|nr:hypothetical protein [Nitrospira sp.]